MAIQHRLGVAARVADAGYRDGGEAFVEAVDSQTVRLRLLASNRLVTEPLDHVTVGYGEERHRPMLVVTGY